MRLVYRAAPKTSSVTQTRRTAFTATFYLLQSEFFFDSGRARHVAWHLKIAPRLAAHFFDGGIKATSIAVVDPGAGAP